MKIAIINDAIYPYTLGGSEIRNYEVARRLVKKGHEVHLIGSKLWEGKKTILKDGIKIKGIIKYKNKNLYDKRGKRRPLDQIRFSKKLFSELSKENYDLIEVAAFNMFCCYSAKKISKIKKTPLILLWQQYFGEYLKEYYGKFKGFFGTKLEKSLINLTDNHIVVSDSIKKELKKINPKKNIKTIHNGVDLDSIKKSKPSKEKYDILFAGRLNYQKNLPLLIEAIFLATKKFPKIKVGIIGSGSEEEILKKQVKKLNLEKNIIFKGRESQMEVYSLMKSSKIFVLPSRLEGFSLVLLESISCGLPIIVTNHPSNPSKEIAKKTGLISNNNPKDFSEKIISLLENPEKRKKLKKECLKVSEEFDWNLITNKTEDYYKKIIK